MSSHVHTSAPVSPAFRRLALSAAITTLVVIAVGGATRATDSGLACPTWPGCFSTGDFLPPTSADFQDARGLSMSGINIWLEHSHRLIAGLLALQIAALLVWVLKSYRRVPGLLWPVVAAAVAVNVQALLGALVVWNMVRAELVTTHLGLGTATMGLMIYVAARARGPMHLPADAGRRRLLRFALVVTGVLWVQILVGGHLTGVHGGLAYVSDPMRGLFSIGPIRIEAEAFNVVHRYLAYIVAGLIMVLSGRVRRAGVGGAARGWSLAAAGLVGVQIILGITNLYSNLSFVSVIPHLMVASWILAAMVMVCIALTEREGAVAAPDPADLGAERALA
ncbi:COX15/CtaA family protein [soil metagenome]